MLNYIALRHLLALERFIGMPREKFTNPPKTEKARKSFKILEKFLQNSRTLRKQKWFENPSKSCKNSFKIHEPCENRNGSKILQIPAKIPEFSDRDFSSG